VHRRCGPAIWKVEVTAPMMRLRHACTTRCADRHPRACAEWGHVRRSQHATERRSPQAWRSHHISRSRRSLRPLSCGGEQPCVEEQLAWHGSHVRLVLMTSARILLGLGEKCGPCHLDRFLIKHIYDRTDAKGTHASTPKPLSSLLNRGLRINLKQNNGA
jgi:hypothetical protein